MKQIQKSGAQASRRILLTRMKFIGDVVLTTPVIRSVRQAMPDAYIAYMGDKEAVSLLAHNPDLNEIIPFDYSRPALIEQTRVALLLRRRKFDIAIDLFGNPRSALLTYLSGARMRVGLDRKGRGKLYTVRVVDDGRPKTAIEFHNQFIRAAGIEPTAARTTLVVTDEERKNAALRLASLDELGPVRDAPPVLVGMHPGATWPAKQWLPERFAELADGIAATLGAQIVVTAGPKDKETIDKVVTFARSPITVLPVLPLRELAAVISHCSVYVSNDAGPMHIAAALGIPTIGLFGPGEENIWFPYDPAAGHRALRRDVSCHPCHLDFCNRTGAGFMECMRLLTVNDVLAAVHDAFRMREQQLNKG